MKTNLLAFCLSLLVLGMNSQSPRLSLYEEFTGENCPPCAGTNPGLNMILHSALNTPKVVALKWQVAIPSAPSNTWSLYQTNATEINARAYNYGYNITSAPSGRLDGQNPTVYGASSDNASAISDNIIAAAQGYTSAFSIGMSRSWNQSCTAVNLTITIQATANFTATGNLAFRAVMTEELVQFPVAPGTNGEKKFEDVAIRSFPSIMAGTPLAGTWTTGQTQTIVLNCPLPSYVRKKEQVAFVGFIQDDGNRKVAQAARLGTAAVPADALANLGGKVGVICSNTISPQVTIKNMGNNAITNLTITPYTDASPGAVTPWSGNLAAGASTTIVLNAITTPTAAGSHVFTYDVELPTIYNLLTNINSVTYFVAGNYQATAVAEGFVPAAYPPAKWAVINNNGGPSWTKFNGAGGRGAGPFGKSLNSTKYDFYTNTVAGDVDELYLPSMDLSGLKDPELVFEVAYAQQGPSSTDQLEFMVSDNCGQNWTTFYTRSGSSLATAGPLSTDFVPNNYDSTHWRKESVVLTGFNKSTVIAKFVVTSSGAGNNLYLDNVNIREAVYAGINRPAKTTTAVSLYPNPSKGVTTVNITAATPGAAKLSVVNSIGQQVHLKHINLEAGNNTVKLDTGELAAGVYMVVVDANAGTTYKKLIVTK